MCVHMRQQWFNSCGPSHIPHLLQTLHFSLPTPPPSGNTSIDEITEHITQFVQRNLMTELALDPSDESLLVSREKVNGHIYHMFKDGQVTLPEPVSVTEWVGKGVGLVIISGRGSSNLPPLSLPPPVEHSQRRADPFHPAPYPGVVWHCPQPSSVAANV